MSATDFKHRERHNATDEMNNAPKVVLTEKEMDNPKYNWIQVGHEKYGRFMFCTNTKVRRAQTMGEFYGSGIVD